MYPTTNDLSIIPFIKNKVLKGGEDLVREPKLKTKGNLNIVVLSKEEGSQAKGVRMPEV